MVGHGEIIKGEQGNLTYLVENDEEGVYQHLLNAEGEWNVRDDVFIHFIRRGDDLKTGGLSVGYGTNVNTIGPELEFGNVIGDHYDGDVLIIKTAWGVKAWQLISIRRVLPGTQGIK